MSKTKFVREYALNASPKMIYPYLSTASGLEQWFCQSVKVNGDRIFNFIWDNQDHLAEMSSHRTNRSARFTFLGANKIATSDSGYIEFTIDSSELSQEQYLRILDYTDEGDVEQLAELWDNLIQNLREIIGG